MKKLALIAALALTLSACGGSSHTKSSPPEPAPAAPVSMIDAFFAAVRSLVSSAPDDSEPVAIDSTAVTAPENSEPEPVQ